MTVEQEIEYITYFLEDHVNEAEIEGKVYNIHASSRKEYGNAHSSDNQILTLIIPLHSN